VQYSYRCFTTRSKTLQSIWPGSLYGVFWWAYMLGPSIRARIQLDEVQSENNTLGEI